MSTHEFESPGNILERVVIPGLEENAKTPPTADITDEIRQSMTDLELSLPVAVGRRVVREGEGLEDGLLQLRILQPPPSGMLGIGEIYSLAPGLIEQVEEFIRGTLAAEAATEALPTFLGRDEPLPPDHSIQHSAGAHIVLSNYAAILERDGTGFKLVDHIAYDPPAEYSPLAAIRMHRPLARLIELGAERYKTIYTALESS